MNRIKFYDKIYSTIVLYNSDITLSNDNDLFNERIVKLAVDDSKMNYDTDISYIKNRYKNYNDFKNEYTTTVNSITDIIYSNCVALTRKYNELKNIQLYNRNYIKTNLVSGHMYIGIDLVSGGVQSLIYNGVLKNYSSWNDLISQNSDNEILKNSKQFRIDVIRKFHKDYNTNLQPFIINTINDLFTGDNIIANEFETLTPNMFLGDELVFDITNNPNKYDDLLGDKTIDGINIHITKFTYYEIGWQPTDETLSIFPIRVYTNGDVYMPYKSSPLYWLCYNHYHNLEDTPNDYKYQFNNAMITTVSQKPDFVTGDELEELKKTKKIV